MRRRLFLAKLTSKIAFISSFSFFSLPIFYRRDQMTFGVSFITHFPRVLTLEEWKQIKNDHTRDNKQKEHTQSYINRGLIFTEKYEFLGHSSRWELVFKDKKTFLQWEREVIGQKHRLLPMQYKTVEKTYYKLAS